MKNLAPIVLFSYNRFSHIKQTIEALQKNKLAEESNLFIYSDGGKDQESWKKVNKIRKYLKTISGFNSITIIEQNTNIGLANSIISGVTEIVNKYKKIIVLEDDIITNSYFLTFMNDALNFYEKNEKIWHISGYLYPTCDYISKNDSFFINVATCWGWATWSRAWQFFEQDCQKLVTMIPTESISKFNLDNTYNWYNHLLLNYEGRMNTWAIKWYTCLFHYNAFCLHPKFTLTKNIGNDNSGVHCNTNSIFTNQVLIEKKLELRPIEFIENTEVREQLKRFFIKGK